jgi:uncharacterized protein YbaR (Trm112 family)
VSLGGGLLSIFAGNKEEHKLRKVGDVLNVWKKGDYTFIQPFNGEFTALFLSCPFCSGQTVASHTLRIASEDPLTVEDLLTCPDCRKRFALREGKAYEM